MRKILILLTALIFQNYCVGQSLKGITIGEKYGGSTKFETTVGGFSGTMKIWRLNDQTVCGFHFESAIAISNEVEVEREGIEVDKFLQNMEANYQIKFDRAGWKHKISYDGHINDFTFLNDNITMFMVSFLGSIEEKSINLTVNIYNLKLGDKYAVEKEISKMKDF